LEGRSVSGDENASKRFAASSAPRSPARLLGGGIENVGGDGLRSPSRLFGVSSAPPNRLMFCIGAMNGLGSGGPVTLDAVLVALPPWYSRKGEVGDGVGKGR
jgi:hypothetical protein